MSYENILSTFSFSPVAAVTSPAISKNGMVTYASFSPAMVQDLSQVATRRPGTAANLNGVPSTKVRQTRTKANGHWLLRGQSSKCCSSQLQSHGCPRRHARGRGNSPSGNIGTKHSINAQGQEARCSFCPFSVPGRLAVDEAYMLFNT